ncbi:type IV pilus modification protein PilV [Pseudoduganella chitinolytica]|uniref:Type IV pilus modification protein PilV n=1 Tax=Pseudoduganella chitinolytica TaxID=34070 RepID=A0ABY8BMI4_9BURK|nr:type IV pilus modification protein PilV [Pseudoduganella chitinolytica]WEF35514.1 type IV pilus modification protein PilV [Pseudoduganella chitinolytica]
MRAVAGFTLIEVLVALLVLAVGLIGGTAMQLHAMRARQESALLSAAVQAAVSMAERIRANPGQAGIYLDVDYDATAEPTPAAPPSLCLDSGCDRAALAALDIHELKRVVRTALPAGRARVCRDAHMWHAGRLRWSCDATPGAPIVVKVGWRGKNPDGTPQSDDAGGFVPGVAMAVAGVRP